MKLIKDMRLEEFKAIGKSNRGMVIEQRVVNGLSILEYTPFAPATLKPDFTTSKGIKVQVKAYNGSFTSTVSKTYNEIVEEFSATVWDVLMLEVKTTNGSVRVDINREQYNKLISNKKTRELLLQLDYKKGLTQLRFRIGKTNFNKLLAVVPELKLKTFSQAILKSEV